MELCRMAICDDNTAFGNILKNKIMDYCIACNLSVEITEYNNGEALLEACDQNKYSLIFLDIVMPGVSGIDVASKLHSVDQSTEIIFVSGYSDYVYEVIQHRPFRYIRKVYLDQELQEALESFFRVINDKCYLFATNVGAVLLKIEDIQYMEVYQHYIDVHTHGHSIKIRGCLNQYEKEFLKWGFIRIHKSYLVSYKYIYAVNATRIILMDRTTKLPLGRRKYKEVKAKIEEYTKNLGPNS